jgi:hypothetical protein
MSAVSFTITAQAISTPVFGPHIHLPQARPSPVMTNQEHRGHEMSLLIRLTRQ